MAELNDTGLYIIPLIFIVFGVRVWHYIQIVIGLKSNLLIISLLRNADVIGKILFLLFYTLFL
ncbi:MAG: hypothetical protein H6Q13_2376 [Bacteroidetes bacterium]|nr:hypothetical protein [Bacteroidota bacterium]